MADKPDVVIELSQEGHDVTNTGDENMIWSSRWPSVKLARDPVFNIAAQNVAQDYDHGWGESTAFFTYETSGGTSRPASSTIYSRLYMNNDKLKWIPGGGEPATPLSLKIFMTDIRLDKNFLAEVFSTGGEPSSINRSQVVALSKPGKDVTSEDLRDFVFHSYCRSPMLHQVAYGTTVNNGLGSYILEAVHNLPYIPFHFVFVKQANGWQILQSANPISGVRVTSDRIIYSTSSAVEASIVVLKEPFTLGSTAGVSS